MKSEASILLVDDEINILKTLKYLFIEKNYVVDSTHLPYKAMEMLKTKKYDAIICDQRMAELTGMDVLEHSRQICPSTIRILLTGFSDLKVLEDAINRCKVHRYFTKPWNNEVLLSVIKEEIQNKKIREIKESFVESALSYNKHLNELLNKDGEIEQEHDIDNINNPISANDKDKRSIISIKKGDRIILISPDDIYYLSASSGKVTIVLKDDKYQSWDALKLWEDRLKNFGFCRCHRSYIINVEKVKEITPWFKDTYNLTLKDLTDNVYASKSYMKILKRVLQIPFEETL
ncbi:LytTR family transcriptional regulator DNA-binding domain-containing protein [Clostridium beijerinckii]|uniref:LytTR family transcriptional regulator DNA-binding domain-containing protein n=1 Tax=Clostridium beijerinckii TaxID=1520 RepID=UPI0022DEADE4|nr:LytTR family transcriptional regulator DNA-binding domain-containing protein [Clostridium beijerinckii]